MGNNIVAHELNLPAQATQMCFPVGVFFIAHFKINLFLKLFSLLVS